MYKVGDKVVYPHHGAGTVVKKEKRTVLGEEREYLQIQILHNDMTVQVPTENADRVGPGDLLAGITDVAGGRGERARFRLDSDTHAGAVGKLGDLRQASHVRLAVCAGKVGARP